MSAYEAGDKVSVEMPTGMMTGVVVEVIPSFGWTGETKYEIHGTGFVTIASARVMRREEA